MDRGETPLYGLATIQESMLKHACWSFIILQNGWRLKFPCSYQRLYFRNANHPITRTSVAERRQDVRHADSGDIDKKYLTVVSYFTISDLGYRQSSHIFDGKHLTTETAAFQLCDIQDSMLKRMIEEEEEYRDTCNVSSYPVPRFQIC